MTTSLRLLKGDSRTSPEGESPDCESSFTRRVHTLQIGNSHREKKGRKEKKRKGRERKSDRERERVEQRRERE